MSESVERGPASHGPWRWLLDLREHLAPNVEVLDAQGEPILPMIRGDVADRVRRLLRAPEPSALRTFVLEVSPGGPVTFTHIDGLRIAAVGVTDAIPARYTLVLAERADAGRDATRRAELARVAAWLARAFTSTSAYRVRDWRELSVLHQVLQKTVATGSVSSVLQAYVEALAIWGDTDTRAYLGNYADQYGLEVSLAGAVAAEAPRRVLAAALTTIRDRRRLSAAEADALGFRAGDDTILSLIRIADHTPWLLAYSGRFTDADEARLALFEDMLAPALQAAAEVDASRLMWVMMQQLVDRTRASREGVAAALAELERAGLCTAALLIVRRGGATVLQLGVPVPDAGRNEAWPTAAIQQFALTVPEPFEATLTLWRPADRPFSPRETRLGTIGASVLSDWAHGMLTRGELTQAEPSHSVPSDDAPVRRDATADDNRPVLTPSDPPSEASTPLEAAERRRPSGEDVSLLVILPDPANAPDTLRETWLGGIRPQLRPTDVIGALPSGEISVLLPGAAERDARAVAARLSRLFVQRPALASLVGAPIGIASVDRP